MSNEETIKYTCIDEYKASNPTPENTAELVKSIAEKHGKTPNAVRMWLSKAGVYVKQDAKAAAAATKNANAVKKGSDGSSSAGGGKAAGTKADAFANLKVELEARGLEYDPNVIERMTGKAAIYWTEIIKQWVKSE